MHCTQFIFNCEVKEVSNHHILIHSGEKKPHQGVIIASNTSSLLLNQNVEDIKWKACMCLYFEVDQTNIPDNTIALIADPGNYTNNLFAYKDTNTGKTILSATTLKLNEKSDKELVNTVIAEIKKYAGSSQVSYIQHFTIHQALPDINDLRMSSKLSENQVLENVFLAGDYLFNGSLNAAMESGRLAALGVIQKKKKISSYQ